MSKVRAPSLPGFETVADLIPEGHFLFFTVIWALRIEFYVTALNDLDKRLVLDLGQGWELDDDPLIRLTMLRPRQLTIPDESQILGLAFNDIHDAGLEGLNYEVYDYEMTSFKVNCHSIELSRVAKPAL
jgi:hypothetical protein